VRNVEGERQEEADGERDGHHTVRRVRAEHLRAERTPGDRVRVVGLRILTGPQAGTGNGEQCWALVLDDGESHDVVEDGADDRTRKLHHEGNAGCEFHLGNGRESQYMAVSSDMNCCIRIDRASSLAKEQCPGSWDVGRTRRRTCSRQAFLEGYTR
jgi:hypothetical protein